MKFSLVGRLKAAVLIAALGGTVLTLFFSNALAGRVDAQRSGAAVYSQNCARCHGADGRAQTAKGRETQAVDFTSDDWSPDADHDARRVANGKGSMPPFKNKLTTTEINAVVQYIRRFKR
jgi:mono/diheme cytochrome c family protein